MVKNLLRVHLLLCMDSYAECSIRLVLEVIRVSVHHQEYMAEIIFRHTQLRVKGRVSTGKNKYSSQIYGSEVDSVKPRVANQLNIG